MRLNVAFNSFSLIPALTSNCRKEIAFHLLVQTPNADWQKLTEDRNLDIFGTSGHTVKPRNREITSNNRIIAGQSLAAEQRIHVH